MKTIAETYRAASHFSSGVNAPGEVRGLAAVGCDIGITATEVRAGLVDELEKALSRAASVRLFVDSGAFSEVAFGPNGREVVDPISDEEWSARLGFYRELAETLPASNLYLVAPDAVGDQDETLVRLSTYAKEVRALAKAGANVIVPVQKGSRSMASFFRLARSILGGIDFVVGVPMKKDATSLEDLAKLAAELPRDARIHLLGLGPDSNRYEDALEAIRSGCPKARVTSDSVTIRRLVGRTNGRGGGPRALTLAQDKARRVTSDPVEVKARAIREVFSAVSA